MYIVVYDTAVYYTKVYWIVMHVIVVSCIVMLILENIVFQNCTPLNEENLEDTQLEDTQLEDTQLEDTQFNLEMSETNLDLVGDKRRKPNESEDKNGVCSFSRIITHFICFRTVHLWMRIQKTRSSIWR